MQIYIGSPDHFQNSPFLHSFCPIQPLREDNPIPGMSFPIKQVEWISLESYLRTKCGLSDYGSPDHFLKDEIYIIRILSNLSFVPICTHQQKGQDIPLKHQKHKEN